MFFDKIYKNKIGWGHAWGGCVIVTDTMFPNIQQNLLCVSLCTICFSLLSQWTKDDNTAGIQYWRIHIYHLETSPFILY